MEIKPQDNGKIFGSGAFLSAFSLGWEMGYTIALPLVIAVILGKAADRIFGTSPLFILAGAGISIALSVTMLYRKMKKIRAEK